MKSKKDSSTASGEALTKGAALAAAAVTTTILSPTIGVIPFILGGLGALGGALLGTVQDGENEVAVEEIVNELATSGNRDVQKKVSFFQEIWGNLRVLADMKPETIADIFDVTRPGVLNWETVITDPKTGKQAFKAKINAFQYHALQELLIAESKLHPENTQLALVLKILIIISLNPNAYTDEELAEIKKLVNELAEYKTIVKNHPNIALKLDDSVLQKLSGFVKER